MSSLAGDDIQQVSTVVCVSAHARTHTHTRTRHMHIHHAYIHPCTYALKRHFKDLSYPLFGLSKSVLDEEPLAGLRIRPLASTLPSLR